MYQNGHGVSENYKEALKWYTKAAEQGDVLSQFSLGWTYENGRGTSQNYQEAVKWYTKASLQGYVMAQFNLGLMHAKGDGVPQSDEQAYIWASLATAQSDAPENAEKLRDLAAKKLTPEQLTAAQQRAAELQKQIEANAKTP
jgi:TPR repeat protein